MSTMRVIDVQASELPETGTLPAGTTIIGIHCEHLRTPLFHAVLPSGGENPSFTSLFGRLGAAPPARQEHPPVEGLALLVMKHQAMLYWAAQLTCPCAEAWWAQHGPRLRLCLESDAPSCPHDGTESLRLMTASVN